MFDWDKIVIEVDNNVVDLTAGEVALLIAADADTVTWGNITGDLTQQADLMLELDSKIGVDSPEFTGTPRTPTPPAGNISTRIANTKFVNDTVHAAIPVGGFGTLASKNAVNYDTEITNKPVLGALSSKSTVNYQTEVTNKPDFGTLAYKSSVDYGTEVTNKPSLYDLSGVLPIESGGTGCNSEQEFEDYILSLVDPQPENPKVRYYVDGEQGNDRTGDGSSEKPFKTIQRAIDSATPYLETIISVTQGVYTEHLLIEGKNIEISIETVPNPYFEGLKLINNDTHNVTGAGISVRNGTFKFRGNLQIDTIKDGIEARNSYVLLMADEEGDEITINCTREDYATVTSGISSLYRSVVQIESANVDISRYKIASDAYPNGDGIVCMYGSFISLPSVSAYNIDRLFVLLGSNAYCEEVSGNYRVYAENIPLTPVTEGES